MSVSTTLAAARPAARASPTSAAVGGRGGASSQAACRRGAGETGRAGQEAEAPNAAPLQQTAVPCPFTRAVGLQVFEQQLQQEGAQEHDGVVHQLPHPSCTSGQGVGRSWSLHAACTARPWCRPARQAGANVDFLSGLRSACRGLPGGSAAACPTDGSS